MIPSIFIFYFLKIPISSIIYQKFIEKGKVISMKKVIIFLCVFGFTLLHAHETDPETGKEYQFLGKHFIASYSDCDPEALCNVEGLIEAMREGVKKSGAQILNDIFYVFPGNGFTMALLLSESHGCIHTYPEHNACFVDLFTCGDHCHYAPFDEALRNYLKPRKVNSKVLIRDEGITEHALQ
jgi:S-adenosylmethionine decarboxylase